MTTKTIIIKSSDYKYPTREERTQFSSGLITPFEFENLSEIKMFFEDILPPEEVKRKSDLVEWNICLLNKLGKLNETYVLLNTSYERDKKQKSVEKTIDNYLFDYYTEIYYYYFFSARDLIAQIINVFYNLGINENNVDFKKLCENEKLNSIKDLLIDFSNATKTTNEIRNSFTHRFPKNYPDSRGAIIRDNGRVGYGFGGSKVINPEDFIKNINESQNYLTTLILRLKVEFKK